MRNIVAGTAPSRKMPEARMIVETWMTNQYEWSAGTSGPTGVDAISPSTPSSTTSASVTNSPRCRIDIRLNRTPNHTVDPTNVTDSVNSYMLPHGIRWAATARVT